MYIQELEISSSTSMVANPTILRAYLSFQKDVRLIHVFCSLPPYGCLGPLCELESDGEVIINDAEANINVV